SRAAPRSRQRSRRLHRAGSLLTVSPFTLARHDAVKSSAHFLRAILEQTASLLEISRERVLVTRDPRHVLVDDLRRRVADEPVEAEHEHREIVELAEHRDEVRDEIDRERKIRGDPSEHRLLLHGHARIAREAPDETCVRGHLSRRLERLAPVAWTEAATRHRGPPLAGTVPAEHLSQRMPRRRGRPPRKRRGSAPCLR